MARLASFPSLTIIQGLKHVVDFACWKGQPYARRWPRPPRQPQPQTVKDQWAAYAYISQQAQSIDPSTKAALESMAFETLRTWRDYQIVLYYGKDIDSPVLS